MTSRRPAAALLTVDVGNTRLRAALWRRDVLASEWSFSWTDRSVAWGRGWRRTVQEALDASGRSPLHVEIASVAPRRRARVQRTLTELGVGSVHLVTHEDAWPFDVDVASPGTVGIDRLANLAGLVAHGYDTGVAIDAGTAITIDVLQAGVFRGGLIAPGPTLQARALHDQTAALPLVPVTDDAPEFGRDTRQAIHAGVVHTTVAGTAAVARRLARRLGRSTPIVLTGGWAVRLQPSLRSARWDPHLLFRGLQHRATACR